MKTFVEAGNESAFQIENAYISISDVAKLLRSTTGVKKVVVRKPFSAWNEIHIQFEYEGIAYVVWEPFGDNSRFWIGPQDGDRNHPSIETIRKVFDDFKSTSIRTLIGNVLTMKIKRE